MSDLDLPEGKRKWLWVGGAAAAAGVAYFWWKRGHGAGAAGDVAPDLAGGEPGQSATGYVNPNPGAHGSGSVDASGGAGPTTGEEWSQRVLSELPLYGWDSQFVAMTLGKYLAGNPLTPEEVQLVQTAWALYGRPAGAPAINVGGAAVLGSGGGGTASRVIVPRRSTPVYPTAGVTRLSPFTPAIVARRPPL